MQQRTSIKVMWQIIREQKALFQPSDNEASTHTLEVVDLVATRLIPPHKLGNELPVKGIYKSQSLLLGIKYATIEGDDIRWKRFQVKFQTVNELLSFVTSIQNYFSCKDGDAPSLSQSQTQTQSSPQKYTSAQYYQQYPMQSTQLSITSSTSATNIKSASLSVLKPAPTSSQPIPLQSNDVETPSSSQSQFQTQLSSQNYSSMHNQQYQQSQSTQRSATTIAITPTMIASSSQSISSLEKPKKRKRDKEQTSSKNQCKSQNPVRSGQDSITGSTPLLPASISLPSAITSGSSLTLNKTVSDVHIIPTTDVPVEETDETEEEDEGEGEMNGGNGLNRGEQANKSLQNLMRTLYESVENGGINDDDFTQLVESIICEEGFLQVAQRIKRCCSGDLSDI